MMTTSPPSSPNGTDRIGVVGLGQMGAAIARRLLDLGLPVHVFDVRPHAMISIVEEGAHAAGSVEELAAAVDVVIAALPSAAISREVAAEAAGSHRLSVYLETSTVGAEAIRDIAATLATADVVDAPLSGGPRGIAAGTVSAYVAGREPARARISSWFGQICGSQILISEHAGAAQVAKIVNNAISLSGMAIASEAIAVGVAAGVDPLVLVDAVNAGTGRNSATADKIPTSILTGRFDYGGQIFLAEKDLELYLELAEQSGIAASTVEASLEAFREGILRFGATADYTEIARVFESAVGAEMRHRPVLSGNGEIGPWRSETLD